MGSSGCSTGFNRKKKLGYTFGNQGCSGCSTGFNRKKNWGIPSEIMVAVVAQPVSTILISLPNYTFGNQGCSGCSTGFNRKKIGLYLRKSWLQWLLNRFQPFLDLSQTIP